jgi:hypothetical protein
VTKQVATVEVYGTASPTARRRARLGRVVTSVVLWLLAISIALAGFVALATH